MRLTAGCVGERTARLTAGIARGSQDVLSLSLSLYIYIYIYI